MGRTGPLGLLLTLMLLLAPSAWADAIIRSQAMLATTIAEFYIERDRVYVELEIGLGDLPAFANILPDQIYEKTGNPPAPLRERLTRFFAHELALYDDDRQTPLPGRLIGIEPRERVRRDQVTGEPLTSTDQPPETVVFARLEYASDGEPAELRIDHAPTGGPSSIGFVAYHDGIAVNDFRYLARRQVLELDWDDPWYSRFRGRALRRAYSAPMSGFIYVEPYEVRKEIIARPKDLDHWIDLGLGGRETIPVAIQDEVKRKAAEFLRGRQVVHIDGEAVTPQLARIDFLERTLRTSRVIDPPRELDVDAAILGAIFVYPTDGLPQLVTMEWDMFNERIQQVPASSVDQAGPLPTFLEPTYSTLTWQNFLKKPEIPTLRVVEAPPGDLMRAALWLRWGLLGAGLLLLGLAVRRRARDSEWTAQAVAGALVLTMGCGTFWVSRDAGWSDAGSNAIVAGLLHNVYRAFDFREEERIYDVLARSVDGDLLADVYLETRKGLVLANQGGARAKIKSVELVELDAEPASNGGFVARARWNASGSVGHWGHVHKRANSYLAHLEVQPVEGVWKLVDLEILEEERL
jgi:hypothetical protein